MPLDRAGLRSARRARHARCSPCRGAARPDRREAHRERTTGRARQDITVMVDADIAFHSAIYAASGNPLIAQSAQLHWVHLRRVMAAVLRQSRQRDSLWDEHEQIAQGDRTRRRRSRRATDRPPRTPGEREPPGSPLRRSRQSRSKDNHEAHRRPARAFDRDGFLFFPVSSARGNEDADRRRARASTGREAYNVREKGKRRGAHELRRASVQRALRTARAPPRMVEPVQDLLGQALYMHQFKINGKTAFAGDVWSGTRTTAPG